MLKLLLLTLVSANNNCSNTTHNTTKFKNNIFKNTIFENTSILTIDKCIEVNNNLIHLTFPFYPSNMTLIKEDNKFCDSKYQPNKVFYTTVNENIMYYPSVYKDNNVSIRYFYDCKLNESICDLIILNVNNDVIYQDLKITIFFYLTLFCIVFSAVIISVLLYALPMTILCCKSKDYMITQIQQGILYQFAFIGIVCIFLFFNKYLEYTKNKYLYSSNIYDFLKIYYGITFN